jgi:isoleucyl-tRNA synthetase
VPFEQLPPQADLAAIERNILARWRDGNVFERSLEQTSDGPLWTFYEGPATANGMPGVHHMAARTFKDLFPRYRTMRGFHVPRKGGWDCHGLPVEVAVEKELGLSGKREIEAYGVAQFNERCRESVLRHVGAWQEMSERMGYWSDSEHAYRTMDPSYIESVWWSLKAIYDKGLLVKDFRISPYCPRCGTPLSDHEMGQPDVYQTVTDPAITVRFRLTSLPAGAPRQLEGADLLVWTTTPWTLLANTAVAVHPDAVYAVARRSRDGDKVVIADDLFARVLGDGWHIAVRFRGEELIGARYQRPFRSIEIPNAHVVIPGSFVTTEDGTGLVHIAPAFGADDMAASRAHGLPVVNPVRPDGRFEEDIPMVGGMFFKDADPRLIADLDDRGLLFRSELHEHSYPHCWRCGTLLLYYALPSWYIKTTAIKENLLYQNEKTNWFPGTVKSGRYGEWLRNNVDWALSRTRYWGTPLPLWVCPDSHVTCVGSLDSLAELAGRDLTGLDPHRPFVDSVTFACPSCGGLATRVPEVIDVWYDSGAMPFAQFGADARPDGYPAQFICEGIDQTRGWFYSLMAVGTLVFEESSYENVLCLGLIVDAAGRKMSKHTGNVLEPLPLMEQYGADALRWFFACSGSPWAARRLSPDAVSEIVRKVLLTYWNTASFFTLYANSAGWAGVRSPERSESAERSELDRWVLSELNAVVRDVTAGLDSFDAAGAGRRLAGFLDDLSNWYVRRSRRSFWAGQPASFATLHECLTTVTLLMAPFAPFLTDYLWGVLAPASVDMAPVRPASVHLASWPSADLAAIDEVLSGQMALVRRLVELGRSARASAGIRTRQPLGAALVGAAGFAALPQALVKLVASELNVLAVLPLDGSSELVDYSVKPSYRSLGQRFGSSTPEVAAAIVACDTAVVAPAALAGESFPVTLGSGSTVLVSASDVIVTQTPRAGWAVATDSGAAARSGSGSGSGSGETVALDVTITPELRQAGLAREVIRLVQDARKTAGLQVTDRIWLRWSAADSLLAQALTVHGEMIAGEVLAVDYGPLEDPAPPAAIAEFADAELGLKFWLRRA